MKAGSLVECISTFGKSLLTGNAPIKGMTYVIIRLHNGKDGDVYLLLEELGPYLWWGKRFTEIQPPMEINIEELLIEMSYDK